MTETTQSIPQLSTQQPHRPLALPESRVTIRPGVLGDIPFMDSLQKLHTKQVGWMPTKQFEGKINAGHVLIAEEIAGATYMSPELAEPALTGDMYVAPTKTPVGYLIGNDQYFKRDDVGIIYQMNVLPGKQRGLIGASLLKAQFERSAWGCRLYCCWCAQDIAANKFWEAMGFVPLAFRTGGEKKLPNGQPRMHIFWQKRIREGDEMTPWWFPSQTAGGSIRSDRIVLPIPPGTHWSDAKPIVLPGMNPLDGPALPMPGEMAALPVKKTKRAKAVKATPVAAPIAVPVRPTEVSRGGFWFPPPAPPTPTVEALPAVSETPQRERKAKPKNDPHLVAAARELRDRWLEQVNASPLVGQEKYLVSRGGEAVAQLTSTPAKYLLAA